MIHGLIKELVYAHEVIAYGFILEVAKVILEYSRQLVEEGYNEGRVGAAAGYGAQVQIVVLMRAHEGMRRGEAFQGVGGEGPKTPLEKRDIPDI